MGKAMKSCHIRVIPDYKVKVEFEILQIPDDTLLDVEDIATNVKDIIEGGWKFDGTRLGKLGVLVQEVELDNEE